MRYIVDNDLHIHSGLSSCSSNPEQNPELILNYAKKNNLKTICITDHFWDSAVEGHIEDFYKPQNFEHICKSKPLPQSDGIRFLFGCEAEMLKDLTLGVSKEHYDDLDFIVIPINHFHMKGYTISEEDFSTVEGTVKALIRKFDALLSMDLPFKKVGIAHLTWALTGGLEFNEMIKRTVDVINALPEDELRRLFTRAAELGIGIEINSYSLYDIEDDEAAKVWLRPYKIAKECGCKFYMGSDAHNPPDFEKAIGLFEKAVDWLGLTEDDKFII